jgi:hypothetical protein
MMVAVNPLIPALAIIGSGLALVRIFLLMRENINIRAFTAMAKKLVVSGNFYRAIKLANATNAAYCRAVREMLFVVNKSDPAGGKEALVSHLSSAFKESFVAQLIRLRKWDWLAWLGAFVAGGATLLAMEDGIQCWRMLVKMQIQGWEESADLIGAIADEHFSDD